MDEVALLKNELHVLKDEIRLLREQNALLLAKRYAPKSERHDAESDEIQDCLFAEEEMDTTGTDVPEDEIYVPGHKRRKGGRKPISEDLPRQVVELDVKESEKVCGCCGKKPPELPPKAHEVVNYTPAKLDVICYERKTYGECPTCCGSEGAANGLITAEAILQVIPQSIATPSLLAYLMNSKLADGLPFYRQSGILKRQGIALSRATMCNWQQKIGEKTEKLWDLMLEDAKKQNYLQMDETPFQVMKEPGKKNTSKSYMWGDRAGSSIHRRVGMDLLKRKLPFFIITPREAVRFPEPFWKAMKVFSNPTDFHPTHF